MSHSHNHSHDSVKNIKLAFFLNVSFTVIEFIGGFFTNSVAIMSDALHDLWDSFSLGLAWFLEKYSNKKRSHIFSYWYKRFSLLWAFINATILLVGSLFILTEAIPRLITPEPSNAYWMLYLAIFWMLVNGYAVYKTANGKSMNERVTELYILDPILSILITLYILRWVIKNLKDTTLLFLQASPQDIDSKTIDTALMQQEYVTDVHDTHVWSLDGDNNVMTTHLVLKKDTQMSELQDIIWRW